MKSSKLFINILITLLTAMLIPFFSIFSMFFLSEKMTQDLAIRSGERVLSQFFAVVDNTLLETSNTALRIAGNRLCQEYSYNALFQQEKTKHQVLEVCNELRGEITTQYYDVFVYYPQDDRIASGVNGSVDADIYLASYYTSGAYAREDFDSILNMEVYRPHIFRMQEYLCVGMRAPVIGKSQRDFMIVMVLKPEFISNLMLKNRYDGDGALLIYDRDCNLLVSSDNNTDYLLDWYDGTNQVTQIETKNGKYTMQVQEAASMEGYYAYVTSHRLFSDYINNVRTISVLCMLVCLGLGCVVAFRSTSKVYKPIKNVADKIESDDKKLSDESRINELELIESILDSNRENKQRINFLNKKSTGEQRKRFILSWIMGRQTEDVPSALKSYDIELLSDCFAIGIIRIQKPGVIEKKQQEFIIQNVFEEIAESVGKGFVVESGDSQYFLLLNYRNIQSAETGAADWEQASAFLNKYYNATVSVYFSDLHYDINEMPSAFREASEAERYRYLLGNSTYVAYARIKGRDFSYVSNMESRLSRAVIGYIRAKTHTVTEEQFVDDIMNMSGINDQSSMDSVECFRYEVFSILNKAVAMNGNFQQGRQMLEELMLCPTLELFRQKLMAFLKAIWQEGSQTDDIYNRADELIHKRYWDSRLSLEVIGAELKRTPYYVSKLFKEKYSISVSEYIAKIRVEQAKKELQKTDKSIADIAADVGFLSSTVFIRTFKKAVGVTPGKYRAMYRNQQAETK